MITEGHLFDTIGFIFILYSNKDVEIIQGSLISNSPFCQKIEGDKYQVCIDRYIDVIC